MSPGPTFLLNGIAVEGNNTIAIEKLLSPVRGRTGTTGVMADLRSIAASITQVYRERGYLLARVVIPPQDVRFGNVIFRVLEGRGPETRLHDAEAILSMSKEGCLLDAHRVDHAQIERESTFAFTIVRALILRS